MKLHAKMQCIPKAWERVGERGVSRGIKLMTTMYDGEGQPERNDACWCGSGKKYKKCHLAIDEQLQHLFEQAKRCPLARC